MSKVTGSEFSGRRFRIDDFAKAGDVATRTTVYGTDSTSGVVWRLKPGQEIVPHLHNMSDDVWICIQGNGVFYPEKGEERPIEKGDIIVSVTVCAIRARRILFSSAYWLPFRRTTLP